MFDHLTVNNQIGAICERSLLTFFFIYVEGGGGDLLSNGKTSSDQGGGEGGRGFVGGEWVGGMEVGLEVEVVFVGALRDLGAVEVTLGGVGVPIEIIPVGEGVDLLTMEQISKMNVVIIAMNMVE